MISVRLSPIEFIRHIYKNNFPIQLGCNVLTDIKKRRSDKVIVLYEESRFGSEYRVIEENSKMKCSFYLKSEYINFEKELSENTNIENK